MDYDLERIRLQRLYPLTDRIVESAGRAWEITCAVDQDALLRSVDEDSDMDLFPFGMLLWHSAIGLANNLTLLNEALREVDLLELGCGCGLPGIVASTMSHKVTQTDFNRDVLNVAKLNAERNGQQRIVHQLADWKRWKFSESYDVVIGSDLLYEKTSHLDLLSVLQKTVRPCGQAILADPYRQSAENFLKLAGEAGWLVNSSRTSVTWEGETKDVALHILKPSG